MKLIRGSYAYIIGLFIMGVESAVALTAFFFALFAHSSEPNPLFSAFGSSVESGIVTVIASVTLILFTMLCSVAVFWFALKKNSLEKPMRLISVMLFFYAATLLALTLIYAVEEPVFVRILRILRCVPPAVLGVFILLMIKGKMQFKIPAIVVCALCGALTFAGYGLYRVFIYDGASAREIRGYISLLIFSSALFLFFVALCCLIGGCEGRRKERSAP